jgi:hypothetical protein
MKQRIISISSRVYTSFVTCGLVVILKVRKKQRENNNRQAKMDMDTPET